MSSGGDSLVDSEEALEYDPRAAGDTLGPCGGDSLLVPSHSPAAVATVPTDNRLASAPRAPIGRYFDVGSARTLGGLDYLVLRLRGPCKAQCDLPARPEPSCLLLAR